MATKSKATRGGNYICKVGYFDIRQQVTMPKKGKNFKGETTYTKGSVTSNVYHGRKLYKPGFKDPIEAIQYIWEEIKKSNLQHLVSKAVISKYGLV